MDRNELRVEGAIATDIGNINILLGRNGVGKSVFLRKLDQVFTKDEEVNVRYISPERAGIFQRNGNILTNMEQDDTWLGTSRRKNQAGNFKQASANLLREAEMAYLRRLESTPDIRLDLSKDFRTDRLERINSLIPNIRIELEGSNFVFKSLSGESIPPNEISSGESESVSLASEIMYFFETLDLKKFNLLLLDEPDVHLHPDLQARLVYFIIHHLEELTVVERNSVAILIATHSTPLVSAFSSNDIVRIGTKKFEDDLVQFNSIQENIKKAAPFFGHPLSLSLSNDVMLILEGEDDERVWQQACRTSNCRINVFPVIAQSVDVQGEMERFCETMLTAIYDDPIAYSIRDGDGKTTELEAIGSVIRFRLHCYAIENALVSDECLSSLGCTWEEFKKLANTWLKENSKHRDVELIRQLIGSDDRLRHKKIKKIRQLICGIAGSNKPWEVLVGQSIAKLRAEHIADEGFGLSSFLGSGLVRTIVDPPKDKDHDSD